MKSFNNLIQLLTLSSAVMVVVQAQAQTNIATAKISPHKNVVTLPTTTVTAKRIKDADMKNAADMYDKPYTRQVVTAERIEQENPSDVTDAIRHLAGVTLVESGGLHKRLSIRGLSGRRVGTLIDGIKLSNQGLDFGGGGDFNSIDTINVEKIEVVKGSPAVLYDPGTAGGAVNIVTKKTAEKDGVSVKQLFGYDAGYEKNKSSTEINTGMQGWGLRVSHSHQKAKDYKVKNTEDVEFARTYTNERGEITSLPPIKIDDLGYDTQETSVKLSKNLLGDAKVSIDHSDWQGKDIAFVYGRTISNDTTVVQNHRKNRKTTGVSLTKARLGVLSDVHVRFAKQDQKRQQTEFSPVHTLDSQIMIASGQYETSIHDHGLEVTSGFEYTQDEAVTTVFSNQDYLGIYANAALLMDNWNLYGGIRHNQWTTKQKLPADSNPAVAAQLVGISGITPEKKESGATWSVGTQYQLTDNQNISLNYSKTYRSPDLLERYAYGGVIGGGLSMLPESGKHTELTYKFLDDDMAVSATAFHSDFDNFIDTKTIKTLTNREGYENCHQVTKFCDPKKEDYDKIISEFFNSYVKYYNSPKVKNQGIEVSGKYFKGNHDVSADLSYNKITSDDIFVQKNANPLRLNLGYKHSFTNQRYKPWVKINATQTFSKPKVKQQTPYKSYFVADLYAGMQLDDWVKLNVGVRNLFDNDYKPAFSALSGLERTFFGSLSFQWDNYNEKAK